MKTINKLPKTKEMLQVGNMGFTSIINSTIQSKILSWEARGLLTYLLSLPDDWDINVTHLINQSPAKRKKVLSIIEELIRFGYVRKEVVREKSGRIMRVEYKVWETPLFITMPPYEYFTQIPQESLKD